MSLFRNIVRFSFSVKRSPSAEFRIELSSSVLLQTLGKFRSLPGIDLSVVVVISMFIRIVLNFKFEFKVLTDRIK